MRPQELEILPPPASHDAVEDRIGRCGIRRAAARPSRRCRAAKPPVVVAEHAQIDGAVRLQAPARVDERHRSSSARARAAMRKTGRRPCSPGSRDRATDPHRPRDAIHEHHVIESVDRLEAHDERRIAVLLEDDRRRDRGLEQFAVRCRTTPRNDRSVAGSGGGSVLYGSALRKRCTAAGVRSRWINRRSRGVKADRAGVAGTAPCGRRRTGARFTVRGAASAGPPAPRRASSRCRSRSSRSVPSAPIQRPSAGCA